MERVKGIEPSYSAWKISQLSFLILADQIARSRSLVLSFCFSGPSGSGKSAYAHHLAERLDLEVVEKRFSDLTSCYLGESEKAIAAAFEEAADLKAFLIIDEADSLLRDRREAYYSWEVSIVNEMLTWMERHPSPFACTRQTSPSFWTPRRRVGFFSRFASRPCGLSKSTSRIGRRFIRIRRARPCGWMGLRPAIFSPSLGVLN